MSKFGTWLVGITGTLMLDEMKLSEAIWFDSKNLLFSGFTDLSNYTPEHQKMYVVIMLWCSCSNLFVENGFKLWQHSWIKGCASSMVLHKLILECNILLENAGFYVDVVTTDVTTDASWNLTMWKHFGFTESDCSCEHPCSSGGYNNDHGNVRWSGRRLWWISDFSHGTKDYKNLIMNGIEWIILLFSACSLLVSNQISV